MGILLQGTLRYWIFALRNVALMRLPYHINTVNNLKIHLDRKVKERVSITMRGIKVQVVQTWMRELSSLELR